MVAQLRQITENDHLRAALDWTVFTLGVLSLSFAIAATIIGHTELGQLNERPQDGQAPAINSIG